jgi:hypothetical protein
MTWQAVSDRLRLWWEGQYFPPDSRGGSGLVFLQGHHQHHWTSRASHVAMDYFKAHHRWIIGLLFGLIVAVLVKAKGS